MHIDDIIPPMMRFQDKNEMKFVISVRLRINWLI